MEKIAIFGNTGFVGTWLSEYLLNSTKKIDLFGYSLKPNTKPSIFRSLKQEKRINYQQYGNVLNEKKILDFIKYTKPNKIIYLASQPIVKIGLKKPKENFLINNIGLINFFESLRKSNLKYLKKVIIFTSDKVYENSDSNKRFIETDNLGGSDPYSASKACQEIISTSYFNSFFKNKFEIQLQIYSTLRLVRNPSKFYEKVIVGADQQISQRACSGSQSACSADQYSDPLEPPCVMVLTSVYALYYTLIKH